MTATDDFEITRASLTVTGATAVDRAYDGTRTVEISSVALSGKSGSDDVSVDCTDLTGVVGGEEGEFNSVTLSALTLTGADKDNYILVQPAGEVTLTAKVTITAHTHTGGTATCSAKAKCTICQQEYGEKDAGNHAGGTEIRDKVEATEDQDGYTGDTYCKGCNQLIKTGKVIPANHLVHTGGTATCSSPAECEICGATYGETDPDNHTGGTEVRDRVEATEDKDGYTGDTYCLGCGTKIADGETIPKLHTTHRGGVTTCTKQAVCIVCGESYGEVDADNHAGETEIKDAVAATETQEGYTGDTYCKDCGVKIATGTTIAKLSHTTHTGGVATCKEPAKCTVCGESYGSVDANNHTGGTEVRGAKEATVTAEGYTGDTYCKGCGAKIATGKTIPKKAHTHTGGTATCTTKAKCTICGEYYGSVDKNNHAGGTEVRNAKAATATAAGYTGDTYCKGCGAKIATGKTIPATGSGNTGNTGSDNTEKDPVQNGWYEKGSAKYWYENGVKQGTEGRGKEIYDPASDAWYWLDAPNGVMAANKDVYQESLAGDWGDYFNENGERCGKWVRYDANGHMVKGWQDTENGTYFFDYTYGTMAKGFATIEGKEYYFNPATGVLEYEVGEVPENGWRTIDGKDYWYENYIRQGYSVDASYRGKEIYDPDSDAWYWLDNIQGGAKAVSKDVYQESLAGEWGDYTGADGELYGKWVRYDENGHMIKGWQTTEAGTYFFDYTYGTMAKGSAVIEGIEYYFDSATGIRQ